MPILILSVLIQIGFVIHVMKTGRNTTWIWIIIALPLAGSIAYFVIELLPGLSGSRTGRKATSNLKRTINPNKDINEAIQNHSITDTVENSVRLAKECLNKEMYGEAKGYFEKCLKGIHEHDPEIMQGLAEAEFGLNNFTKVKVVLDDLIKNNPDYKNPDAHLLYARSLEELNNIELALEEYQALDRYYPGPEASYRYALLLKKTSKNKEALELFNKIIHEASHSGKHHNDLYKKWIKLTKIQLKS